MINLKEAELINNIISNIVSNIVVQSIFEHSDYDDFKWYWKTINEQYIRIDIVSNRDKNNSCECHPEYIKVRKFTEHKIDNIINKKEFNMFLCYD